MLATHAQPALINSLLCITSPYSLSVSTLPLIHVIKLRYFSHRRSSARTVTSMSLSNATAGDSPKEHVAGEWFSVPELRLRDHRFIVPLDYSADPKASSRISIFAREVVSGKFNFNRIISWVWLVWLWLFDWRFGSGLCTSWKFEVNNLFVSLINDLGVMTFLCSASVCIEDVGKQ